MAKEKKIQDYDIKYSLLRHYVDFTLKLSYRNIRYVGRERIPTDGAIIYGYTDSPVQAYAEENKLQFLPLDVISLMGDLNGDQQQSVADLVMLQKWLMGEDVEFSVWYAADYDRNAVLNAVDLSMMKRELIAGNTH